MKQSTIELYNSIKTRFDELMQQAETSNRKVRLKDIYEQVAQEKYVSAETVRQVILRASIQPQPKELDRSRMAFTLAHKKDSNVYRAMDGTVYQKQPDGSLRKAIEAPPRVRLRLKRGATT